MPMTDAQTLAQTRQALTDVYRQHRNPQLFFRDYGAALDALLADGTGPREATPPAP